ncbi:MULTISPECIES: HpcH/HpaI aldolase/citrate lyase family protein [Rhodococcus]|uniref:HpcH/HpaI aldolase/citrate lyase family protein n=1 Tax=Rhodococcus globerulus TaxID=33008 RepID=UPI001C564760|nr:CoA ester lyase [Rhodococcus globerulus]QXV99922.1 CoA ester lyase [Rhodococcus globerulus]
MKPYRTLLFVPGHKPEWALKALRAGADAIVLDLEDSVPEAEKEAARKTVAETIDAVREHDSEVGLFVRPNALGTRSTGADLETVVLPGLTGIFAPKIETVHDVVAYDALLDHFEQRNGADHQHVIVPVETVKAIHNCREIALASSRISAMIGPTAEHADIAREVGFEWSAEGSETLYLRSRILLACREAGLHALTGLWEELGDLDGLAGFANGGRRLGFRGMVVIHPSHVSVVNAAFTPSETDIAFYRGLADAYLAGERAGDGAVRYRGLHIDRAHYDKALQWLEYAAELTEGSRNV